MQGIESPTLTGEVRLGAAQSLATARQFRHAVDLQAASEAVAALHLAAARARECGERSAGLLTAADRFLRGRAGEQSNEASQEDFLQVLRAADCVPLLRSWIDELRALASLRPETGACTIASAFELWLWTWDHFRAADATPRLAIESELAEALARLAAARCFAMEFSALAMPETTTDVAFRADLAHVQAARTAAGSGSVCAELVFGYRRHLTWDAEGCATCFDGEALDDLESFIPGIASGTRGSADVVESDGSHPAKAGPCARFEGVEPFLRLRRRLDGCLTGARIAHDRAAAALARTAGTPEGRA